MALKDKLLTLPKKPGCYQMKDRSGKIIYVGKAINLFNRVNSYFRGAHDYKTTKLVSHIVDFDYIVTKSEKEALILEYNLIKEYDPEYNRVFRDDQSYPYILLSAEKEPYCSVVRLKKTGRYKGKLFGPYPNVGAARNTVDLINHLFPTRKCFPLKKELCLYYHIHQCLGYCVHAVDDQELEKTRKDIDSFLSGDIAGIIRDLKVRMQKAVDQLDYEQAAQYRDLLRDVQYVAARQDVQIRGREDFDVFNYAVQDGYIAITGLFIRKGKLLSTHKFLDYLIGDPENYVSSYLYQFYQLNKDPKTLYVPSVLMPYLDGAFDFPVKTVTKGNKSQLFKQAEENSLAHLEQHRDIIEKKERYLIDAQEELKRIFGRPIHRIELFDNSHTAGKETVAAMVVYKDLKPSKKDYRLYKLEEGADDLKSMKEVMYRRYFRMLKEGSEQPDLIIVDGARIQIEAAKEILGMLEVDIPLAGLGKDDHHETNYLMDSNCKKIEIDKKSNLFFVLANMQDEVHRFAISYHRKRRARSVYRSPLDGIPGLGEKRRTMLLRKYRSIAAVRAASLEELQQLLPEKVAEAVYDKLKGEDDAGKLQ
ncbi:MAG: excinuclease ABC subunit C [Erysipelotrichaceae bacterium]|nr:excinuclease ABC subunit C [Erysipelotrichaceae bacterium]